MQSRVPASDFQIVSQAVVIRVHQEWIAAKLLFLQDSQRIAISVRVIDCRVVNFPWMTTEPVFIIVIQAVAVKVGVVVDIAMASRGQVAKEPIFPEIRNAVAVTVAVKVLVGLVAFSGGLDDNFVKAGGSAHLGGAGGVDAGACVIGGRAAVIKTEIGGERGPIGSAVSLSQEAVAYRGHLRVGARPAPDPDFVHEQTDALLAARAKNQVAGFVGSGDDCGADVRHAENLHILGIVLLAISVNHEVDAHSAGRVGGVSLDRGSGMHPAQARINEASSRESAGTVRAGDVPVFQGEETIFKAEPEVTGNAWRSRLGQQRAGGERIVRMNLVPHLNREAVISRGRAGHHVRAGEAGDVCVRLALESQVQGAIDQRAVGIVRISHFAAAGYGAGQFVIVRDAIVIRIARSMCALQGHVNGRIIGNAV